MRFLPCPASSSFPCLPNSESASPSRGQLVPAQPTLRRQNHSFIFLPDLPSLRLSGQWDTNRADKITGDSQCKAAGTCGRVDSHCLILFGTRHFYSLLPHICLIVPQ